MIRIEKYIKGSIKKETTFIRLHANVNICDVDKYMFVCQHSSAFKKLFLPDPFRYFRGP